MRIVHFIETLDPRDGGPPQVAAKLAAEQARQGHRVTLLTTFESGAAAAAEDSAFSVAGQLRNVERRSIDAKSLAERLRSRAKRQMGAIVKDADVIHAHGIWDPMLVSCVRECSRSGIPVSLTPHGMLTRFSLGKKAWKKRLALATLWRGTLRQVSSLHLLTQAEYNDVQLLDPAIPGVVIPNGVEPGEFAHDEIADIDGLLPRHASRRYILFLARISHIKGPDLLCEAFARIAAVVPDVDLVMAGPDFGYRSNLARQVQQLGLQRRIHVVGPVYGKLKSSLLRRALCLAHLSRHEGFSITVLEALACGTPVVISNACNFSEVASAGAGLVVPLDPQQGAQALLKLLSDPAWLLEAGTRARQLVQEKYTARAVAQRLVEHYSRLGRR